MRSLAVPRCLAALALLIFSISPSWAQRRPLVVVFAPTYAVKVTPKPGNKTADTPLPDRTYLAMRAVRDRLEATRAVDALAYDPDSPTFIRAVLENKLQVNSHAPTTDQQIAVGKAMGALYVVLVFTDTEKENGVVVEMHGTETATRKVWAGRERVVRITGGSQARGALAAPFPDDLLSAANTLVQGFARAKLRDYLPVTPLTESATVPGRVSLPANPDAAPPADPALALNAAMKKGEDAVRAGDVSTAIPAFRAAVNLAPRATHPRLSLIRAYLQASRPQDAAGEARRALGLVPEGDVAEVTRLLAESLKRSGDKNGARGAYEQVLAAQPEAHWARVALGDILLAEGDSSGAEAHYLAVRKADPKNHEATRGLARLKATRGDYPGARGEIAAIEDTAARSALGRDLFEIGSDALAVSIARDRKSFDDGQISREAFYRAAAAQAERANALLVLLQSAAPPAENAPLLRAHRRRILAASLLSQAASSVLSYLETGEPGAGSQASLLLAEAKKEMAQARAGETGERP